MACNCGGKASNHMAYKVTWTDSDGDQQIAFVPDMGAYRLLKADVAAKGGTINRAIQVPRAMYDEWDAHQRAGL